MVTHYSEFYKGLQDLASDIEMAREHKDDSMKLAVDLMSISSQYDIDIEFLKSIDFNS